MTDAEWASCVEPATMLRYLDWSTGKRPLRLFAVACCRRVSSLLTRPAVLGALRTAERYAERQASLEQLRSAKADVRRALSAAPLRTKWEEALMAVLHTTAERLGVYEATLTADASARALDDKWREKHPAPKNETEEYRRRLGAPDERARQCNVLRDIFRRFIPDNLDEWRAWRTTDVVKLALAIYEEERFQDLPVLADALEDAGCQDPDILDHCRARDRLHVRGCWLLDGILGRTEG